MCKVGTSALGAAAAASHTASLAGNDAVYEAVFRRYGVLRAHSITDFFALAASAYIDRKSTRLNSSHLVISYAVFCLKKKKNILASYISSQTPTVSCSSTYS